MDCSGLLTVNTSILRIYGFYIDNFRIFYSLLFLVFKLFYASFNNKLPNSPHLTFFNQKFTNVSIVGGYSAQQVPFEYQSSPLVTEFYSSNGRLSDKFLYFKFLPTYVNRVFMHFNCSGINSMRLIRYVFGQYTYYLYFLRKNYIFSIFAPRGANVLLRSSSSVPLKQLTINSAPPDRSLSGNISFYRLIFNNRAVNNFYALTPENEHYNSSEIGALHFIRSGISKKHYNFFFFSSFAARRLNINRFGKFINLLALNRGKYRLKSRKLDILFFDKLSANVLSGFSKLTGVGVNLKTINTISKTYDVSKIYFSDEFAYSSFFNNLNNELGLVDFRDRG